MARWMHWIAMAMMVVGLTACGLADEAPDAGVSEQPTEASEASSDEGEMDEGAESDAESEDESDAENESDDESANADDDDGKDAELAFDPVGTTWQWQRTIKNDDTEDVPADPSSYTLTMAADGSATVLADCNTVLVTYTMDGSSIEFDMEGPATLAMCPPDSLDSVFLQQLGEAAIWFMDDGDLMFDLMMDAGTMRFSAPGMSGGGGADDDGVADGEDAGSEEDGSDEESSESDGYGNGSEDGSGDDG